MQIFNLLVMHLHLNNELKGKKLKYLTKWMACELYFEKSLTSKWIKKGLQVM